MAAIQHTHVEQTKVLVLVGIHEVAVNEIGISEAVGDEIVSHEVVIGCPPLYDLFR